MIIDHLLVFLLDRWVIGTVLLAALASLALWVRVKPSGRAVILLAAVLWTASTIVIHLSQLQLEQHLIGVLIIPAACIAPLVLFASGRVFAIVLGIACLLLVSIAFVFNLSPPANLWAALAIACAGLAYRLIRTCTGPSWTAVALSLLVLLPFLLLPANNWKIVAASVRITQLCAAEGGQRIFSTVQGVEGLLLPRHEDSERVKQRGLRYIEWPDKEGLLREENHIVSKVEAFSAPYESKARQELLPLGIVMTEAVVVSRTTGEVLGRDRGFHYGPLPPHFAEMSVANFAWPFRWAAPACGGNATLFPASLEARTINPRPGPRSYIELSERKEIWDWMDPQPQVGANARPRYVLVKMGSDEAERVRFRGHQWASAAGRARARILVRPELDRRGWCPASFAILDRSVESRPDGGSELTVKCL